LDSSVILLYFYSNFGSRVVAAVLYLLEAPEKTGPLFVKLFLKTNCARCMHGEADYDAKKFPDLNPE